HLGLRRRAGPNPSTLPVCRAWLIRLKRLQRSSSPPPRSMELNLPRSVLGSSHPSRNLGGTLEEPIGEGIMKANTFIAVWCLGVLACESGESGEKPSPKPDSRPDKPLQLVDDASGYAGRSLETWGIEYVRWFYAQPTCQSTRGDRDGSRCDQFQNDPDVF